MKSRNILLCLGFSERRRDSVQICCSESSAASEICMLDEVLNMTARLSATTGTREIATRYSSCRSGKMGRRGTPSRGVEKVSKLKAGQSKKLVATGNGSLASSTRTLRRAIRAEEKWSLG